MSMKNSLNLLTQQLSKHQIKITKFININLYLVFEFEEECKLSQHSSSHQGQKTLIDSISVESFNTSTIYDAIMIFSISRCARTTALIIDVLIKPT